jgi:hypothetical protein
LCASPTGRLSEWLQYYQTSSLSRVYRWVARAKNGLPLTDLPRSGRSLKIPPKTLKMVYSKMHGKLRRSMRWASKTLLKEEVRAPHHCLESTAPSWGKCPTNGRDDPNCFLVTLRTDSPTLASIPPIPWSSVWFSDWKMSRKSPSTLHAWWFRERSARVRNPSLPLAWDS